jgi:hypothetical protein
MPLAPLESLIANDRNRAWKFRFAGLLVIAAGLAIDIVGGVKGFILQAQNPAITTSRTNAYFIRLAPRLYDFLSAKVPLWDVMYRLCPFYPIGNNLVAWGGWVLSALCLILLGRSLWFKASDLFARSNRYEEQLDFQRASGQATQSHSPRGQLAQRSRAGNEWIKWLIGLITGIVINLLSNYISKRLGIN